MSDSSEQYVRVLIGCGAKKRDSATEAKRLYTSNYFKLKREFAELYGDELLITSAEHGILQPDTVIEPYDKSLTNMSSTERREWGSATSDELRELEWDHVDVVVLLMGQLYIEPIEPTLNTLPVTVGYPFDHTEGNGEQIHWLQKRNEAAKRLPPTESVELDLDPIQAVAHDQQTLTHFDS